MADQNGVRKKKSKLEKIAELESNLKLSKEENRRLKKEVHLLKSVGSGGAPVSPKKGDSPFYAVAGGSQEQLDKMKDALKALKRVTINQEMSLQSLRAKASQRRQELESRDNTIGKMKRHIAHLKKQLAIQQQQGSNGNLQERHNQLQDTLLERDGQIEDLQERLGTSESKIKSLERQLEQRRGPFARENSSNSMKSHESGAGDVASVSTAQEFDLSKLKKEIAKKSSKIVDLEYQLELVKDQLHEVRAQNNESKFAGGDFVDFGNDGDNPFGGGKAEDDFYDSEHGGTAEEEDDWW